MLAIRDVAQSPHITGAYSKILNIIAKTNDGVRDSIRPHAMSDIIEIKQYLEDLTKSKTSEIFGGYKTLKEVVKDSIVTVGNIKKQLSTSSVSYIIEKYRAGELNKEQVADAYQNSLFGIGTGIDPSIYTEATIPISMSPYEGAALYSGGGVPQIIIKKKARGILLNGFTFEGLDIDDAKRLKEHAIKTGFDSALPVDDALVYGGAVMYPVFKKEGRSINTFLEGKQALLKKEIIAKDSISRWVSADRWNVVMIPNYTITADDYLHPKSIYLPLGAIRVNTERCAMIRPTKLSFWGAISQLGWSTSDYVGYVANIYDLKITMKTFPILFQQMSLLFQLLPLDAVLLTNGVESAKEISDYNAEVMANASILKPAALNSIGDIKVIDRSFLGAEPIVRVMRQDLAANANIPESVIYDSTEKGFVTDKTKDVTLKQSEGVKMLGDSVSPQLQNLVDILVVDCFGANSKQAKANVRITFNPSIVLTEQEKADKGLSASQYIKTLRDSGFPLQMAVKSAKQYFNFEISEEDLTELEKVQKEMDKQQKAVQNQVSSSRFPKARVGEKPEKTGKK